MTLAPLLVGLAGAVEGLLRNALVLDTIINDLASLARARRFSSRRSWWGSRSPSMC